jgi:uncharacterized membrane protein YozB (DUF420 family)
MEILKYAHSGLRWVALTLLLIAIINAFSKKGKSLYEKKDKMINLFTMISLHTQLLLGLILTFSGKFAFKESNPQMRFYLMEHIPLMLLAIILVTIGRKKAEKTEAPYSKHQYISKWYLIGLILILAAIPWPFRNLGTGWF